MDMINIFPISGLWFIIASGIITCYIVFLTAKGSLTDNRFSTFSRKVTRRGKLVIFMSFLLLGVYVGQEKNTDTKMQIKNKSIDSLNVRLAKSADSLRDYLVGQNRYAQLVLNRVDGLGKRDAVIFRVVNKFHYPVFDIEIKVYDWDLIKENLIRSNDDTKILRLTLLDSATFFTTRLETLEAGQHRDFNYQFFLEKKSLFAIIHSRGKTINQKLVFYPGKDGVYVGYEVLDEDNEVIEFWVSEGPDVNNVRDVIIAKLDSIPDDLYFSLTK